MLEEEKVVRNLKSCQKVAEQLVESPKVSCQGTIDFPTSSPGPSILVGENNRSHFQLCVERFFCKTKFRVVRAKTGRNFQKGG